MKKIEALQLVHPCLGRNLQTAADTLGGFLWVFDPAVGEQAERLPSPGYVRLDVASFGTGRVIGSVAEREKACSVRHVVD